MGSPIAAWGLISIQLQTPTHAELRVRYEGLDPKYRQSGLDDENQHWFAAERNRVGRKVAEMASVPVSRQLLKRGCPNESRQRVWENALGVELQGGPLPKAEFELLMREVDRTELLIDDLVHLDVQSTALDANFFPFEDGLDACLMAFTRDHSIVPSCATNPTQQPAAKDSPFPPCGVVPFRGLVFYAAPLCYLYKQDEEPRLYSTFRALYTKYFCRLHHISSDSRDIIALAKTFEDLLVAHDPALFYHLIRMDVDPLRIAFTWIFYGFCGYLEIDQVLSLWDRIIGYDSLEVLPVLAVSIFLFRSAALLEAESEDGVHEVFEDATRLKVVPLLQHFLFLREDCP
jgi:hypothetical protein